MYKSTTCLTVRGEPCSTYYSEAEALEGAKYVKLEHGTDMSPYQCSKCGDWHLKHAGHLGKCSFCKDANGNPKELYATYEAAKRAASFAIEKGDAVYLEVYKCPCSNGYHLTHS